MGRLDLPDVYRDEDYYWPNDFADLRGDAGNPGTRQVPAPPAKGGVGSSGSTRPASSRSGATPLGPFFDYPEAVEHPLRAGEARDESHPATATEPQDA